MNAPNISMAKTIGIFTLIVACTFSVQAQNWIQLGDDIDGEAAGDHSGNSVSLNSTGNILAVGAPENDGNIGQSGHVRIYEWLGSAWAQMGTDIDGETSDNRSGRSVNLNSTGDVVAIGAPYNNDAGHVRVYEWNGSAWIQRGADIDGEAAVDLSGESVSLNSNGDIVAIGAPNNDGNGIDAGHVRIFRWDGSNWIQMGADIDGEAPDDQSGESVSLNSTGDAVAIGAVMNDGSGEDAGHVRIYDWNGSAWIQRGSDIDGEAASDLSGESVSLNGTGDVVAIGASRNDGNGTAAGHVRIYEWNGSAWIQRGSDIDGEAEYDYSGNSVSLNSAGDLVAIGAFGNDGDSEDPFYNNGHVRVYMWNGAGWTQRGSDIDGEATLDASGSSVSLNSTGEVVAIGAKSNDGNGSNSGHVRVFSAEDISTPVQASEQKIFSVYPNPTKSVLRIQSNGISDRCSIEITSINGQLIFSKKMLGSTHEFDLSSLQRGIYIISITSQNLVTTEMIVKL
jgi:hypothetical protein